MADGSTERRPIGSTRPLRGPRHVAADDAPPHRYDAALAAEIEARWQDRWDAEHTFEAPNPAGPLADPERVGGRPKLFLLDMFPYPSGAGLHVGHPARLHRHRRVRPLPAHEGLQRPARPGLRRLRAARPSSTPSRPAPTRRSGPSRTSPPTARQLRRLGLAHDPRRSRLHHRRVLLPLDPVDLPADLRVLVRPPTWTAPGPSPSCAPNSSPARGRRPMAARGPSSAPVEQRRRDRRPPAGLHRRGAGQLVPRPGHGPGQRGGHRRRPQRPRQLPGLPPEHAPVDDADHGLRRPPHRRPRPAGLARVDQDDAAQLDRPLRRGHRRVHLRRRPHRGVHHPAGHAVRRHVHGAGPEHPLVDALDRAGLARAAPGRCGPALHATPAEAVAAYRAAAAAKTDLARQAEDREKTGVFTGSFAVNPANGDLIPIFVADYVLMGYGTGAIMAVPGQDERDWEFAERVRPAHRAHGAAAGRLGGRRLPGRGPGHQQRERQLDLDGLGVADGQGRHRSPGWRPTGHGRATDDLPAAGLVVQPPALLGRAVPDRLRRRPASPSACRSRCCPSRCRRSTTSGPSALDPDDATSEPELPLSRVEWWASGRAGPGRRADALPARAQRDAAVGRLVLVRAALPGSDQREPLRRSRGRAVLDGPDQRPATPAASTSTSAASSTPCCTCCTPASGTRCCSTWATCPSSEPYRRLFNQGYILAAAYKDAREIYVDAHDVEPTTPTAPSPSRDGPSSASGGRWARA